MAEGQPAAEQAPDGQPPSQADHPAPPADKPQARRPRIDFHAPFLQKLRDAGHDPLAFRAKPVRAWLASGAVALVALGVGPLVEPGLAPVAQRLAALLGLAFLIAALGLWARMGVRAFPVAFAGVAALYGITAWTGFVADLSDVFAITLLIGFGLFTLAGFNLVFVLEEAVYDAHRHMHLRHPAWSAGPALVVAALTALLPLWDEHGGPALPATWIAAIAATTLLALWWFLSGLAEVRNATILRELHLLVAGGLAASLLADGALYLRDSTSFLPSAIAYIALLGTWFYVSYTTLQRTHFLLRGRNTLAWICILLAASLAVLSQAQALYLSSGSPAVADLVGRRAHFLVAGVWIGIAFLVARGLGRSLRLVAAEAGLGDRTRRAAGAAAHVTERVLATRKTVGAAAISALKGVDRALPGRQTGWELDADTGKLRSIDDEE